MKIEQWKKFIVTFYMTGFFIGILYANIFAEKNLTSIGVFSEYFLTQYASVEIELSEYIVYILKNRLIPLAVLIILSQTKIRKIILCSFFVWIGFSGGMLLVASIMQLGVQGILLCLIGMTPHFFFYCLAYLVVIWYFLVYPRNNWAYGKTLFVIFAMLLGVVCEVYVNPVLMKMFVNAI